MDFQSSIQQLVGFLKANDFASGGLVVGLTGVLVAALRKLPGQVVRFVWRQLSLEVVVRNDTDLFDAVEYWLAQKGATGRTRVFSAKYRFGAPDPTHDETADDLPVAPRGPRLELSPGYGYHWIWHRGRPVLLFRAADTAKTGVTPYGKLRESLSLYFLGRNPAPAESFFREAIALCNPPESKIVRVFAAGQEGWRVSSTCRLRSPATVVLRAGVLDRLVADVRRFFDRQTWYTDLGIPYRRGYLFTGPPGNGKTTTVLVLAGVFEAPVCILDLANPQLTDEKLRDLMNSAPVGAFFLLEDIDALFRAQAGQDGAACAVRTLRRRWASRSADC